MTKTHIQKQKQNGSIGALPVGGDGVGAGVTGGTVLLVGQIPVLQIRVSISLLRQLSPEHLLVCTPPLHERLQVVHSDQPPGSGQENS